MMSAMPEVIVGRACDLAPGQLVTCIIDGRQVCVANIDGRYVAFRDTCPHQGARLSQGTVAGTMMPSPPHQYKYGMHGCIIRCPWHGWEFDMRSGQAIFDPGRRRLASYDVSVVNGDIAVHY
jgi:3-phenylpropionate/trans-cinnamate dioxygenase ferredoxin subunit